MASAAPSAQQKAQRLLDLLHNDVIDDEPPPPHMPYRTVSDAAALHVGAHSIASAKPSSRTPRAQSKAYGRSDTSRAFSGPMGSAPMNMRQPLNSNVSPRHEISSPLRTTSGVPPYAGGSFDDPPFSTRGAPAPSTSLLRTATMAAGGAQEAQAKRIMRMLTSGPKSAQNMGGSGRLGGDGSPTGELPRDSPQWQQQVGFATPRGASQRWRQLDGQLQGPLPERRGGGYEGAFTPRALTMSKRQPQGDSWGAAVGPAPGKQASMAVRASGGGGEPQHRQQKQQKQPKQRPPQQQQQGEEGGLAAGSRTASMRSEGPDGAGLEGRRGSMERGMSRKGMLPPLAVPLGAGGQNMGAPSAMPRNDLLPPGASGGFGMPPKSPKGGMRSNLGNRMHSDPSSVQESQEGNPVLSRTVTGGQAFRGLAPGGGSGSAAILTQGSLPAAAAALRGHEMAAKWHEMAGHGGSHSTGDPNQQATMFGVVPAPYLAGHGGPALMEAGATLGADTARSSTSSNFWPHMLSNSTTGDSSMCMLEVEDGHHVPPELYSPIPGKEMAVGVHENHPEFMQPEGGFEGLPDGAIQETYYLTEGAGQFVAAAGALHGSVCDAREVSDAAPHAMDLSFRTRSFHVAGATVEHWQERRQMTFSSRPSGPPPHNAQPSAPEEQPEEANLLRSKTDNFRGGLSRAPTFQVGTPRHRLAKSLANEGHTMEEADVAPAVQGWSEQAGFRGMVERLMSEDEEGEEEERAVQSEWERGGDRRRPRGVTSGEQRVRQPTAVSAGNDDPPAARRAKSTGRELSLKLGEARGPRDAVEAKGDLRSPPQALGRSVTSLQRSLSDDEEEEEEGRKRRGGAPAEGGARSRQPTPPRGARGEPAAEAGGAGRERQAARQATFKQQQQQKRQQSMKPGEGRRPVPQQGELSPRRSPPPAAAAAAAASGSGAPSAAAGGGGGGGGGGSKGAAPGRSMSRRESSKAAAMAAAAARVPSGRLDGRLDDGQVRRVRSSKDVAEGAAGRHEESCDGPADVPRQRCKQHGVERSSQPQKGSAQAGSQSGRLFRSLSDDESSVCSGGGPQGGRGEERRGSPQRKAGDGEGRGAWGRRNPQGQEGGRSASRGRHERRRSSGSILGGPEGEESEAMELRRKKEQSPAPRAQSRPKGRRRGSVERIEMANSEKEDNRAGLLRGIVSAVKHFSKAEIMQALNKTFKLQEEEGLAGEGLSDKEEGEGGGGKGRTGRGKASEPARLASMKHQRSFSEDDDSFRSGRRAEGRGLGEESGAAPAGASGGGGAAAAAGAGGGGSGSAAGGVGEVEGGGPTLSRALTGARSEGRVEAALVQLLSLVLNNDDGENSTQRGADSDREAAEGPSGGAATEPSRTLKQVPSGGADLYSTPVISSPLSEEAWPPRVMTQPSFRDSAGRSEASPAPIPHCGDASLPSPRDEATALSPGPDSAGSSNDSRRGDEWVEGRGAGRGSGRMAVEEEGGIRGSSGREPGGGGPRSSSGEAMPSRRQEVQEQGDREWEREGKGGGGRELRSSQEGEGSWGGLPHRDSTPESPERLGNRGSGRKEGGRPVTLKSSGASQERRERGGPARSASKKMERHLSDDEDVVDRRRTSRGRDAGNVSGRSEMGHDTAVTPSSPNEARGWRDQAGPARMGSKKMERHLSDDDDDDKMANGQKQSRRDAGNVSGRREAGRGAAVTPSASSVARGWKDEVGPAWMASKKMERHLSDDDDDGENMAGGQKHSRRDAGNASGRSEAGRGAAVTPSASSVARGWRDEAGPARMASTKLERHLSDDESVSNGRRNRRSRDAGNMSGRSEQGRDAAVTPSASNAARGWRDDAGPQRMTSKKLERHLSDDESVAKGRRRGGDGGAGNRSGRLQGGPERGAGRGQEPVGRRPGPQAARQGTQKLQRQLSDDEGGGRGEPRGTANTRKVSQQARKASSSMRR